MLKKVKLTVFILSILVLALMLIKRDLIYADWWDRPAERPTQPSYERELPPEDPGEPSEEPETPPEEPETPPGTGDPGTEPSDNGTDEDPCAPGKSYTGDYCGWSPKIGGEEGDGGVTVVTTVGPEILGLSYTSSDDLELSDIIFLTGVLCLLLYLRSKLNVANRKHHR